MECEAVRFQHQRQFGIAEVAATDAVFPSYPWLPDEGWQVVASEDLLDAVLEATLGWAGAWQPAGGELSHQACPRATTGLQIIDRVMQLSPCDEASSMRVIEYPADPLQTDFMPAFISEPAGL